MQARSRLVVHLVDVLQHREVVPLLVGTILPTLQGVALRSPNLSLSLGDQVYRQDCTSAARLVVREIKKAKSEYEKLEPSDVFSAMPLVESLKALVSHVMTERVDKRGRILVLALFDVSRAHFYGGV